MYTTKIHKNSSLAKVCMHSRPHLQPLDTFWTPGHSGLITLLGFQNVDVSINKLLLNYKPVKDHRQGLLKQMPFKCSRCCCDNLSRGRIVGGRLAVGFPYQRSLNQPNQCVCPANTLIMVNTEAKRVESRRA